MKLDYFWKVGLFGDYFTCYTTHLSDFTILYLPDEYSKADEGDVYYF